MQSLAHLFNQQELPIQRPWIQDNPGEPVQKKNIQSLIIYIHLFNQWKHVYTVPCVASELHSGTD